MYYTEGVEWVLFIGYRFLFLTGAFALALVVLIKICDSFSFSLPAASSLEESKAKQRREKRKMSYYLFDDALNQSKLILGLIMQPNFHGYLIL